MSFFHSGPATDSWYLTIRDDNHPYCSEARTFVETLWRTTSPYLDPDLPHQAQFAYYPRFWEMYLTNALITNGIAILPLASRQFRKRGPDLQLIGRKTWLEAVVATVGTGPDAVPESEPGSVSGVPDDQMVLRLRTALEEKARKYRKYLANSVVEADDILVVAVGAARIPLGRLESPVPRIVRAVFPFGDLQVHIERDSGNVVGESYTFRPAITKASGSLVGTDIFLRPEYSHISAVLFASADELNHPPSPGPEFVTVHNSLALNPLPHGFFGFGREYWKEGNELKCKHHGHEPESGIKRT